MISNQNNSDANSDIPYISHEETAVESDHAAYYTVKVNSHVAIHPNPSYNINRSLDSITDLSGDQYVYPEPVTTSDIYDDVSGVHEYLSIS